MTAMIGTAVRNSFFDGGANRVEVIGQIARVEVCLHRHHPAADIDTDCGRNDRALRWDHTAYRRANAPVDIWHGRDPLKNERELCYVQELLTSLAFELHSLGPRFDGRTLLRRRGPSPNEVHVGA